MQAELAESENVNSKEGQSGEVSSKQTKVEVQAQAKAKTHDVDSNIPTPTASNTQQSVQKTNEPDPKETLIDVPKTQEIEHIIKQDNYDCKTDTKESTKISQSLSKTDTSKFKSSMKTDDMGDLTRKVADVASSLASTLESITAVTEGLEGSHYSSDEGEEQLMLMKDSPRWEDEEIQAEDLDEPRAIKAEIKLMVKTTELGKEAIEIRSIREFVDLNEQVADSDSSRKSLSPNISEKLTSEGDRIYKLQRDSLAVRTPSPRFVRSQDRDPLTEEGNDEFDLMAQVRGKPGFWLAALFYLPPCVAS